MQKLIELLATNTSDVSYEIEGVQIPANTKKHPLTVTRSLADKLVISTSGVAGVSIVIVDSNVESADPLHVADKEIKSLNEQLDHERQEKARVEAEAQTKLEEMQKQLEEMRKQLEAQQATPPAEVKTKSKAKKAKSDEETEAEAK